jgi:hypothetical protein
LRGACPALRWPRPCPGAYKQLLEVERGWRDLKQAIDLRPVYHRKEQRIHAHVTLCWLAFLLIRIAETTTGEAMLAVAAHPPRIQVFRMIPRTRVISPPVVCRMVALPDIGTHSESSDTPCV